MDELPMILNTEMMAKLLNVSEQTVRKECSSGRLPATKIGRRWICPRDRFVAFLHGGEKIGA